MHPLQAVRKNVFDLSQESFAKALGVNQSTVSRWENGTLEPSRSEMEGIRGLARQRNVKWDDRWFFDAALIPDKAKKAEAA